jgi:HK97 gp10 family phage protein
MAYAGYRLPSISASPEFAISMHTDAFDKLLTEALDGAMREAMEEVAEKAREFVPVDTGLLRESIHTARYEKDGLIVYQVETGPGRDNREYGLFVELGTVKTKAQPFLRPAMAFVRPADKVRFKMKKVLAAVAPAEMPVPSSGDVKPQGAAALEGVLTRAARAVRGMFGSVVGRLKRWGKR